MPLLFILFMLKYHLVGPFSFPVCSFAFLCLSASDCSVRKMNRNKAFHIVNLRHEHREPVDISLNSMQPLMLNLSASQMWLGCTPSLSFLVLCPSDGVFAHTVCAYARAHRQTYKHTFKSVESAAAASGSGVRGQRSLPALRFCLYLYG